MGGIDQNTVKGHYELYNRLQNSHRQNILVFIYEQPRTYSDLVEYTQLKPGSLYHHLKSLHPLVEKESHGFYSITAIGKTVAEEFNLVLNPKPQVQSVDHVAATKASRDFAEDTLAKIWLLWPSYLLIFLTLIITWLLASEGVSLAGSAIYATSTEIAIYFDFTAFALGLFTLFSIETLVNNFHVYNRLRFTFTIRLISMIPAAIMGIALLLLFLVGFIPDPDIYPWLFAFAVGLGMLVAASGIQYLRGVKFNTAVIWAGLMGVIDLLLGFVVLVSDFN